MDYYRGVLVDEILCFTGGNASYANGNSVPESGPGMCRIVAISPIPKMQRFVVQPAPEEPDQDV